MEKCIFNKGDGNLDLLDHLVDVCEDLSEVEDLTERKSLFIGNLKELGEGFTESSHPALAEFIKEYIDSNYPDLSDIVPVNADIYLSGKTSNIDETLQESEAKTNTLEMPDDVGDNPRGNFISKSYGTATEVQTAMEASFRRNVVNSFIVNRDKGTVISDTTTLNGEVREYQEQLLQNIVTYLKDRYQNVQSSKYDTDSILNTLNTLSMYKDGRYTGAVETVNGIADPFFSKQTSNSLNEYYSNALARHIPSKKFIDAYNSYVILNNFDPLLRLTLGKVLEINPETNGKFVADSNKYSLNGKNNLPTSWRTTEDIFPEREISNIDRLLVETTPMYLWQGEAPMSNRSLGLQEFNYIVCKVKDLVTNSYARDIVFDGQFFNDYPELAKHRSRIYGKTLYELIALVREHPETNLSTIFSILCDPKFFSSQSTTLLREFYRPDMDIMYSLYKGMFEDSPNSLFGIKKRNPGQTNYYSYITQTANSIANISYAQYRQDEYGNIVMRTLKDSSLNLTKLRIENKINGMLSKVAPIKYDDLVTKYNASYEDGIFKFTIPNADIIVEFKPSSDRNTAFTLTRKVMENGQESFSNVQYFEGRDDWNKLLGFFNDFLKLDFAPDSTYMSNYLSLKSEGENVQYDLAINDLLQFSTSVFFNSYLSHKLTYPEMSWTKLDDLLANTYDDKNRPNIIKSSGEISLISRSYTPVLNDLANANSMTTGMFASSIVRDAEGSGLGSTSITRMFDSTHTQWAAQCLRNPRSASRGFSLLNNPKMLRGVITSREYKGRDSAKRHTQFNVAESYFSSLVYDYVGGLVAHEGNDPRAGVSGFMPSVNSDKTTILKMLINMNDISAAKKAYAQLSKEEIRSIINSEIGTCYTRIMDNILQDFAELANFAKSTGNNIILNPLTNFSEFNALYGKDAANQLAILTKAYNSTHRVPLEFIDQVHFINNKGKLAFNRSLVSLTNRFSPGYFSSKNFDPSPVFGRLTTANEFWNLKERELLSQALDNNFVIETTNSRGRTLNSPEIQHFAKMGSWIDPNTKRVILAKFTPSGGGATVNISKWSDFGDLGYTEQDSFGRTVRRTYLSDGFDISKLKGKLELHPTMANHNALDYLFTQEYMLSTVGTHISHPAKKAANDVFDLVEEAARYVAQHKRNVSFTASMHVFQQDTLTGIPSAYRMAVIDDLKAVVFNVMGDFDKGGAKPYDGATFVNPFVVYLENNSLGGSKAGIDKKQFIHSYKENTCTGIIIKTAGFGLTNDRIRESAFYRLMMKKMTDHVWTDNVGIPFVTDITKDFRGNPIRYDDMYYKDTDGKFYMIKVESAEGGNNFYAVTKSEVDPNGNIIRELPVEMTGPVNTNYALWNMFGGMNSMELKDDGFGNKTLQPSEVSITNVVKAMNSIGIVTNPEGIVDTQEDIYQVLKHSDIHYVPTAGAVKQGAANINSSAFYSNTENYNIMTVKLDFAGIQLDASHEADEANLSIMTQVISSLASRGYTADMAQEVYDALSALTEYGIRDYIDGYSKYLETENPEEFQNVITKTIVKSLMNSTSRDGSIVQAVAETLLEKARQGKELKFKDTKGIIPYSDPSVFNQLVSTISSSLTKAAIRVKFNGTLSVLNPSHGIWKLYGDRKLGSFNNSEQIEALQKIYDTRPLKSVSEIQLGRTYNVTVDGITLPRFIETPQQYWDLKEELTGKEATIVENITVGRDLATYNVSFSDIEGTKYNMWDLDEVKNVYNFRTLVDAVKNAEAEERTLMLANLRAWLKSKGLSSNAKEAWKQLQEGMQRTLGAIGSSASDAVVINGVPVLIDKSSVDIRAYETIMPKIYATKFGLLENDDLQTIKNDRWFFLKRMLAKDRWNSKVDDADFDVELKRINGKHTYLVNKGTFNKHHLTEKNVNKLWDGDKVYRVNEEGQKLYRLSSDEDLIFTDIDGNEVIVTDNIDFYVGASNYHTLRISDSVAKTELLAHIWTKIEGATNKPAQRFIKRVSNGSIAQNILAMNETYRTSIESLRTNPDVSVKDPNLRALYNSSMEIHSSFIKSLDVLAARIPAQTMQSFMPMKVVAFDNPDVNSAYVNYWQIWLQGSDFDIDKVSLLGYSFDRTGKYVGWSPYFNLKTINNLKASEMLPFPTGKKVEVVPTNDESLTEWFNDYVGESKLFNFVKGNKLSVSINNDAIQKEIALGDLAKFLRYIRSNGHKLFVPAESSLDFEAIKKFVDTHNTYLQDLKDDSGTDMIRNFISTHMYKISSDPINLIQSQSPIDLGDPQTAAEGSTAGKLVKTFTPGNNFNKHISLFENMAGKEVIGITAAGMKIFFALTQYYNTTLRSNDPLKQSLLLFNKTIAGQNVQLLANSYTSNLSTIADPRVLEAISTVVQDKDAALILSALLSCATDNAKELILSKINAGADMVSLYIYGIAIGIDFNKIADIMMSRTAKIISKIKSGNVFNDDSGIPFLTSVFDYLDKGPRVSGLDYRFKSRIAQLLDLENDGDGDVREALNRKMHDTIGTDFMLNSKLQFIEQLKKAAVSIDSDEARISSFKFIDKLEEFVSSLQIIQNEGQEVYDTIKELYFGGSELRRLGSILGLNQQLRTKVDRKLSFIRDFENLFTSRFAEFDSDEGIRKAQLMQPSIVNGQTTTIGDAFDALANFVKDDNLDEDGNVIESRKYRISFTKFINDEAYRDTIISLYNGVKHTFNILDVVWSLPHFRGYLKTAFIDYAAQSAISSKFRAIDRIGSRVIDAYGFKSSRDIMNVYRGVQSFLDNTLINSWLKTSNKVINIPKGVTIFSTSGHEFTTEVESTPILLGTEWGNASFKRWMESTVIPDLKEGIFGEGDKSFMDNKFILDLSPMMFDKTVTRNATFVYTLPVSMIPKSDAEKAAYAMYKSEFNKLQYRGYRGYPISDLFFYYNLINFRNVTTQNSLTPMFEEILRDGSSPLLQKYNAFVSEFDTGSDLLEGIDYIMEDVIMWCAPFVDTYRATTPYVYSYDYNTMTFKLYKRRLKVSEDGSGDDTLDGGYYEGDDFYDYGDFYMDNFYEDSDESGDSKVNPDYEVVEDYRDRRYFLTRESSLGEGTAVRLNSTSLVSVDRGIISEVKYNGKNYAREEVIAKIKNLGGSESDLDIPYMTVRVNGFNYQIVDTVSLLKILDHTFNNPC